MLKDMKSYAHLKPGQKGTMRLVEKYGKALLCVRYRYDEVRDVKLKTVENTNHLTWKCGSIYGIILSWTKVTYGSSRKAAKTLWQI